MITRLLKSAVEVRFNDVEYIVDGELVSSKDCDFLLSPDSIFRVVKGGQNQQVQDAQLRAAIVAHVLEEAPRKNLKIKVWD